MSPRTTSMDTTEGGSEQVAPGFPSRYSSHGAVASHFQAYGGETWIDFLRESGTDALAHHQPPSATTLSPAAVTGPRSPPYSTASSSTSRNTLPNRPQPRTDSRTSDRKRRLTTADTPLRRPSSLRMHSGGAGNTNADPIVLDSSPASASRMLAPLPPLPPLVRSNAPSGARMAARQSDMLLPRWQPDSDVAQCPVCGRHFTFLFRKHHCRKCGRVVCSACSPHRITIPRQFIVQPPSETSVNFIDLTADDETTMSSFGPFCNPALGGGEEVRVCNPCVPDPNYTPPPQYIPAASSPSAGPVSDPSRSALVLPSQLLHPRQQRSTLGTHHVTQPGLHGQTHRPHGSSGNATDNRRVSYHGNPTSVDRWLPPLPSPNTGQPSRPHYQDTSPSRPNHDPSFRGANVASWSIFNPIPSLPQQTQPHRPRHQLAEEDECPICGNELPPKAHGNDESARTQHIEECIALHSASPAPALLAHQTSTSLPTPRARGMSNPSARNGEASSNYNRLSHAARGMFPYIATEKDCIDDEGREEECIICLEDFEAGDKMARLVCWCKFHESCIKEWWEKKGRGACPTHQLQE